MRGAVRSAARLLAVLVGAGCTLLAAGTAVATGPHIDTAPTPRDTSFSFASEPGDPIGLGRTESFTPSPTVTITATGSLAHLSVSVDVDDGRYWRIDVSPGRGDVLRPGVFRDAERDPVRTGRAPGLDVSGEGRACDQVYGVIALNQIGFDRTGALDTADLTFVQHCETATAPPLRGIVHVDSLPLSYRQSSEPGDYIGGGIAKLYINSTSTFHLAGSATRFEFEVSGLRHEWAAVLSAPTGTQFVPGTTYETTRSGDAAHAGLDVSGDGRSCSESFGSLIVRRLTLGRDGSVKRVFATFTQHCETATAPALTGVLHYKD